ncbi:SMI1/KNR4 family protein [Pedobacter alluvionis]|uniref:Benzoate transporter n=1 Tax=Pedobacter alluvionis TaxID=475253 RepID=A0A497XMN6_9SPHI|nr:SMI1/KNR4 family protein [Pedobacter alluvionis]RLJ69333.1 cell wall assembly regulator SMI1 [Pedobacter alluvionis]TFB30293.1 benzoate transporter [Pedobacter alluvionis]
MDEIIQKLDKYLSILRPEYYRELNEPLDDSQLDKLEEYYKIEIPKDLRILYKWKNGQKPNCYEAFVNNSMFIPLHQALYDASELTTMIGFDFEIENWWNENWIPIFQNGGGDSTCYDLQGIFTENRGQLIEFWHADNDRNVIAPALETFFEKIIGFYETIQREEFDEYFKIGGIDNYPKKFIVE